MKDVKQNVFFEKLKIYVTRLKTNARKAYRQILGSPLLQKTAEKVKDLDRKSTRLNSSHSC